MSTQEEHPRRMNPTQLQHQHHHYLCDDCEMEIAEHDFVGSCDVVYRLCPQCNKEAQELLDEARMEEEERRIAEEEAKMCDRCHTKHSYVHIIRMTSSGEEEELHLCEHCEDADERDHEENLGGCVCCRNQDAVVSFHHISNGTFELCDGCFQAASHDADYGKDFVKEEQ